MTLRQRLISALMAEGYDEEGARDVVALVMSSVCAHFAGDVDALAKIGEDVPAPRSPASPPTAPRGEIEL